MNISAGNCILFANLFFAPPKNGIYKSNDFMGRGINLVKMNELFSSRFIDSHSRKFDKIELTVSERERLLLKNGDLLFSRTSVVADGVGKCSIVRSANKDITYDSNIIRIRLDTSKANPFYYFYFFNSPTGRDLVRSLSSGAAVTTISGTKLSGITVPYPSLGQQNIIANDIYQYDLLIENNTRRIQILEEMAQAIYREWFVHFRYPGHEGVRMVQSELGKVPEGWEWVNIRDVTSYINRGVSPKYDDNSEELVINQKCIRDNQLNLEPARRHASKVPELKMLRFGDVLINSTGVGTLGRVAQTYQDLERFTVDSHVTIARPNERVTLDYFGYFLLGLQEFFDRMGTGATNQTELGRETIANADFLFPPYDYQQQFSDLVKPMRMNIINLQRRNANLRQQRDLLLPRLISGELDVSSMDFL